MGDNGGELIAVEHAFAVFVDQTPCQKNAAIGGGKPVDGFHIIDIDLQGIDAERAAKPLDRLQQWTLGESFRFVVEIAQHGAL